MQYQGKDIEVLSRRVTFGKHIANIRVLATGALLDVDVADLHQPTVSVSAHELAFRATAARIRNEVQTQPMLAPLESNIVPLPHQILALEKVMSGSFIRYLMADEVGMGKTIEAGLILKELKLRGLVKRALIIVPKSALLQWKEELKKHFNETFHIYDSEYINTLTRTFSRLDADNEINLWSQHNQLIVSMDALKPLDSRQGWSRDQVAEYNRQRIQSVIESEFDLLIIDECHKVGGSRASVGRYQMADILCSAIPNVLLLSATPHRGKSDHFRRVLQLLDADAFAGEGAPTLAELGPYVVRTEKRQAIDYDGKPLFNKRKTEKIEVLYDPFRHRKQQQLYVSVSEYVVNGFNLARQTKNTSYGFVMILFQRLMSSSTQAILEAMQKRADRLADQRSDVGPENILAGLNEQDFHLQMEMDFDVHIDSLVAETVANYDTELEILRGLIRDARECLNTETDAKVDYLLEKLGQLKREQQDPELKFLIFTEFTSSQTMLRRMLEQHGGYVCESINGSMDFERRVTALKRFKEGAQILVSTDAAGESLNMQFAHIVINYDMPWNPMVVEQRIGRVDRIGQPHEVLALNLLLDNSIDRRVYEVVETKLTQIMQELGIDKTSDVLDSTLERAGLQHLYLTSLLEPARFEQESQTWLDDIRQKLQQYRSTEGLLPTMPSEQITPDKADAVRYSPLPKWLETLTHHYLSARKLPYTQLLDGLRFRFPGQPEQIYTFDLRDSLVNPIPEPLSLQHEVIQTMLAQAVPLSSSQPLPRVRLRSGRSSPGWWTLWELRLSNQFDQQQLICPLFSTSTGDIYPAFAQDVWGRMVSIEDVLEVVGEVDSNEVQKLLPELHAKAENALMSRYLEMEAGMLANLDKIRANKERAFSFQERQLQKIGIDNIRQARLLRLQREQSSWLSEFDNARRLLPDLRCLLAFQIVHD